MKNIIINPSQAAVFVDGRDNSKVELVECTIFGNELPKAFLFGANSSLTLKSMYFKSVASKGTLIEADPAVADPNMSITLDRCHFFDLDASTSRPIVSGERILKTTIKDCLFKDCHCSDTSPLPEPTANIAGREVTIMDTHMRNNTGPLSGLLTFGVQASKLNISGVTSIANTNSARFSNCVTFTPNSVVHVMDSTVKESNTTELWPSGGFLYLPSTTTTLTIDDTKFFNDTAAAHGGSIFVATEKSVELRNVDGTYCGAGKDGGFLYFGGHGTLLVFKGNMTLNMATRNGGSLFLADYATLFVYEGLFNHCKADESGGAVALTLQKGANTTFKFVKFVRNKALDGLGQDVLATKSENGKKLTMAAFVRCKSETTHPKVTLMPEKNHANWSNSHAAWVGGWVAFVVVMVLVVVAVSVAVPLICCYCGYCTACGVNRKGSKSGYTQV
ncbi:hypothetical protein BLNAU_14924 [Blattamonas nauphoetae]|uniref:Right handed beta helix domain-containing protein n=1 Tax=Blattamonas nauphoetae TaxID=2049346 RepID=A0ABQ9XC84_9EUKA|nr:hypothetical protein BLNAU_14924 [Blattamonas nauphoetae]